MIGTNSSQPFDLFILNSQEDYACYIRATVMLDQHMAFECPFLKDPARAKFNLTFYNETFDPSFVDSKTKYREYLFIVDNTDFPLFENPDSPFPT